MSPRKKTQQTNKKTQQKNPTRVKILSGTWKEAEFLLGESFGIE